MFGANRTSFLPGGALRIQITDTTFYNTSGANILLMCTNSFRVARQVRQYVVSQCFLPLYVLSYICQCCD